MAPAGCAATGEGEQVDAVPLPGLPVHQVGRPEGFVVRMWINV